VKTSAFALLAVAVTLPGFLAHNAAGQAAAAAPETTHDPALHVPADAALYLQVNPQALPGVVRLLSMPPVMGFGAAKSQAFGNPFGHLDMALGLDVGTTAAALPHLEAAAFALAPHIHEGSAALVLIFDSDEQARKMGESRTFRRMGVVGNMVFLAADNDAVRWLTPKADADGPALASLLSFQAARKAHASADVFAYAPARTVLTEIMQIPESAVEELRQTGPGAGADDRPPDAGPLAAPAEGPGGQGPGRGLGRRRRILLRGLGLARADVLSLGVDLAKSRVAADLRVAFMDDSALPLKLLGKGAPGEFARVPADAAAWAYLNWGSGTQVISALREFLGPPNMPAAQQQQIVAAVEQQIGMPLADLGALFGDGLVAYCSKNATGMLAPDRWAVAATVTNTDRAHALLGNFGRMAGLPDGWPYEDHGAGLSAVRFKDSIALLTIEPKAAVLGGEATLRHRLAGPNQPPGPAIKSDAALMIRLNAGQLVGFYDAQETRPVLTLALGKPDANTLALTLDLDGLQHFWTLQRSGLALPWWFMPQVAEARGAARQAAGMNNLRQTGLGLVVYRNDHDEALPARLEDLVQAGYIDDPQVFQAPGDRAAEHGARKVSFEYVGALPGNIVRRLPANVIIAYTHPGVYRNRMLLLQNDCAVMSLPVGAAMVRLQQSYDVVREVGGDDLDAARVAQLREVYRAKDKPADGRGQIDDAPPGALP
jgi:hypothetical protein